ncbi:unnamed protein product, partial [Prorocentrum cordatum]
APPRSSSSPGIPRETAGGAEWLAELAALLPEARCPGLWRGPAAGEGEMETRSRFYELLARLAAVEALQAQATPRGRRGGRAGRRASASGPA